jgi:signal transduction histidine kinase
VPYEALAAFSRGLGEQPDLDLLLPCVAETAADAVSATSASVRLEMSNGAQLTRRWPQTSDGSAAEESVDGHEDAIPVTDRSGRLGSICVTMPADRPLRPDEQQLLADLADQTAIAFRNARMEAELAAHVRVLDAHNEELEASRRRLIEAGDAERRRLEAAIARDVLPSLADLPGAVDAVRASLSTGAPAESIDGLVDAATDALEALRDLTRGVFPTVLARSGLGPALSAFVSRTGCSARLAIDSSLAGRRFSARVEAAAYFCATESLPNDACADEVRLRLDGPDLVVEVRGRRRGDMDLQAMVDRVEALAGTLVVEEPAEGVITLMARIPVEHATQPALQGSR